jgi:hypothetical protein
LVVAFALIAGCGDTAPATTTPTPDLSMTTTPGTDMAGTTPGTDSGGTMTGGCGADGTMCTLGSVNGLCSSNACAACTDTTDDAKCATAYGAGNICVAGNCQMGCHDSSTCSGKICDPGTNTCRSCTQDADCPAATPNCNTTTGACSATAVACTTGMACNGGFCCAAACVAGANCCQDTDCGGSGATCVMNVCKSSACTDVAATANPGKYYVDPLAPNPADATQKGKGVGTKQCPFTSLDNALSKLKSQATAFTVCTRGTFDSTSDKAWPKFVHTNVTLDGHYCGDLPNMRTAFNVPSGNAGVFFVESGPAGMLGYNIIYVATTKNNNGIFVSNSGGKPVTISEVTVNSFQNGIAVGKRTTPADTSAGTVVINNKTFLEMNGNGLSLNNGATVTVDSSSDSTSEIRFSSNTFNGIYVADAASTLKMIGVAQTGMSPADQNISVGNNGYDGLNVQVKGGTANLTFVSFHNNTLMGLRVNSGAKVTARSCGFVQNTQNGFYIFGLDDPTLGGIDLGKDASTDPGKNKINNNTQAGVCIPFNNTTPLLLRGNYFGAVGGPKDCTVPNLTPKNQITGGTDCKRALDIAGTNGGSAGGAEVNPGNCSVLACNGTTAGICPNL